MAKREGKEKNNWKKKRRHKFQILTDKNNLCIAIYLIDSFGNGNSVDGLSSEIDICNYKRIRAAVISKRIQKFSTG